MPHIPSADLARRIADATRALLARGGPTLVTHRAAEAGVATKSVANRFGTRAVLLDHVALWGFVELIDVLMNDPGGPLTEVEPARRLGLALFPTPEGGWAAT